MIPAIVEGKLARATRGARGECPECGDTVYARVPDHAIRHWAHIPLPDGVERMCTIDSGEMTEWHKAWQDKRTDQRFIEYCRETPPAPRADVVNLSGFAIEFQHSPISAEDVTKREKYWGRGVWVLDGTPSEDWPDEPRVELEFHPDQSPDDPYRVFRWPRAPALLWRAKWPCWIDLNGEFLLQVRQLYAGNGPQRGNGWLVTEEWFVDEVINGKRLTLRTHNQSVTKVKPTRRRPGQAREEDDEDLEIIPACTRGAGPAPALVAPSPSVPPAPVAATRIVRPAPTIPPEPVASWRDAPGCAQCGQPLLLVRAGRDTCARCQPQQVFRKWS